jgi:hypothetical protein
MGSFFGMSGVLPSVMSKAVFLFSNSSTNRGGMTKRVDLLKLKAGLQTQSFFNLTLGILT